MRNFGSSIFISLSVLVLLRSTSQNYSSISENLSLFHKGHNIPALPGIWQPDDLSGLFELSGEIIRQASMIGYINSFHLMAYAALLVAPLAMFMRVPPKEIKV